MTAKLIPMRSKMGSSGDGPEGPMLEPRVARLETDVAEIKVSMRSVQDTLIRIEAKMDTFATKEDVAALRLETREGMVNSRAEMQKLFGDGQITTREGMANSRVEMQKLFGDGQITSLRWLFALIIPIYLGLLAFGWQTLKALNQPSTPRTALSQPAPTIPLITIKPQ